MPVSGGSPSAGNGQDATGSGVELPSTDKAIGRPRYHSPYQSDEAGTSKALASAAAAGLRAGANAALSRRQVAKCDMLYTFHMDRLELAKGPKARARRTYHKGKADLQTLEAIRDCVSSYLEIGRSSG